MRGTVDQISLGHNARIPNSTDFLKPGEMDSYLIGVCLHGGGIWKTRIVRYDLIIIADKCPANNMHNA
jgi:hypothetical protein